MRPGRKGGVCSSEHRAINRAKEHVRVHLTESLVTERVAASVGLTPSYFCRLFKKQTGKTFHRYVQELRVERAKSLLRDRQLRVKEVAFAAGFHSSSNFDHVFAASEGVSPLEYQVNLRQ